MPTKFGSPGEAIIAGRRLATESSESGSVHIFHSDWEVGCGAECGEQMVRLRRCDDDGRIDFPLHFTIRDPSSENWGAEGKKYEIHSCKVDRQTYRENRNR